MHIFVTGASGHLGSAVVPDLLAAGHRVTGLARSDRAAATIAGMGAAVRRGQLDDLAGLKGAARESDGAIHLAFRHDLMGQGDYVGALGEDLRAIEALAAGLQDSGKPLVVAGGTIPFAGTTIGALTEEDVAPGGPRIDAENVAVDYSNRGVRSSVVRLPPIVHSNLDQVGFVPTLVGLARARGTAGFIGDGSNRWPSVHTLDAARLFRLALEAAPAGSRLHAVAETGVPFRDISKAIGSGLGVPSTETSPNDMEAQFSFLAGLAAADNPTSSELTRELLDWRPENPNLREDLAAGHYFAIRPPA